MVEIVRAGRTLTVGPILLRQNPCPITQPGPSLWLLPGCRIMGNPEAVGGRRKVWAKPGPDAAAGSSAPQAVTNGA